MDLLTGLVELFAVVAVAAVAPLVAALIPHQRVPQVVLLILGGILIGPQGLGLEPLQEVELVANVGLGFVFLLAGFEIDPAGAVRPGRQAGPGGLGDGRGPRHGGGGRPGGARLRRGRSCPSPWP